MKEGRKKEGGREGGRKRGRENTDKRRLLKDFSVTKIVLNQWSGEKRDSEGGREGKGVAEVAGVSEGRREGGREGRRDE